MKWFKPRRIFLDYASATPVLPEVKKVMEKYWSRDFYNPNAIYEEGLKVKRDVEECRDKVAKILGVAKEGVVFTSGGTEANTLAIQRLGNRHVVIDARGHPSITEAAKDLAVSTWHVDTPLPIQKDTTLITTVGTNNKIGREARDIRRREDSQFPLVHIDASQTIQYYKIGMEILSSDLITLDASKFYGPKGVGVLAVRRGVAVDWPSFGTPSVPLIIGFTKALEIAVRDRELEFNRLSILNTKFQESIKKYLPYAIVTCDLPNIINISVPKILPEFLVLALDRAGILVSAGPACHSNKPEPPETPVRFSFGRSTTKQEVARAARIFCQIVGPMLE